jgi:hypothetical protein
MMNATRYFTSVIYPSEISTCYKNLFSYVLYLFFAVNGFDVLCGSNRLLIFFGAVLVDDGLAVLGGETFDLTLVLPGGFDVGLAPADGVRTTGVFFMLRCNLAKKLIHKIVLVNVFKIQHMR